MNYEFKSGKSACSLVELKRKKPGEKQKGNPKNVRAGRHSDPDSSRPVS